MKTHPNHHNPLCKTSVHRTYLLVKVWVPVLVSALLHLASDLDGVVGVRLDEGLGAVERHVDAADGRKVADDDDGTLEAELEQLRRERLCLRLDEQARRRRRQLRPGQRHPGDLRVEKQAFISGLI